MPNDKRSNTPMIPDTHSGDICFLWLWALNASAHKVCKWHRVCLKPNRGKDAHLKQASSCNQSSRNQSSRNQRSRNQSKRKHATRKVAMHRDAPRKDGSVLKTKHAREKKSVDKVKDAATKMQQQRRSNKDAATMIIMLLIVGLTYQLKLINWVLINKRLSIDGAYQQLVDSR